MRKNSRIEMERRGIPCVYYGFSGLGSLAIACEEMRNNAKEFSILSHCFAIIRSGLRKN